MIETHIDAQSKAELYRELGLALRAITEGESEVIANLANASALLWEHLPDINWAGFYRVLDGELVLGPFQGKVACIRIPFGKGVCGTAAETGSTQLVTDVHAFPGHIACDAASQSEIVVPIMVDGAVFGVLDIDSPKLARFDEEDRTGCEALVAILAERLTVQSRA